MWSQGQQPASESQDREIQAVGEANWRSVVKNMHAMI